MSFTWGVNVHPSYSGLSTAQQLDLAQQMGLTSLRVDVYDASASTQSFLSQLLTQADARGMTILPVIVPSAAATTTEAAARAWGLSVGSTLAKAFPSLTWEAGNELDEYAIKAGAVGQSTSDFDDTRYAQVRGAIGGLVDGIHSADASAKVAVGITGIHFGFLQRLAADGVTWDLTSEHYYAAPGATDIKSGADSLFSTLAQFHHPIVMTEFDQQQGSYVSPGTQAATLVTMMDAMSSLATKYDIVGGYIYELLDEPRVGGAEAHYGLANENGVLNSAGTGVQQYLHSTPASDPSPPPSQNPSPALTEKLVSDTGASATDGITSNAALSGTAHANSVIHFTVDGATVGTTVTANATGSWSWTPSGLGDGAHVVAAAEAGSTTAASLNFTLDTHAPAPLLANGSLVNGNAILTGTSGAGETVSVYDGNALLGTTKTAADGSWSFNAGAPSNVAHNYHADGTDLAGNVGHGAGSIGLGSSAADTLSGGAGNDMIVGMNGNDTLKGGGGADRLTGGAGNDVFSFGAAADSTPTAADTITDFQHGVDKIDFTNIAGITASSGTPQWQGMLSATGSQTLNPHSVAAMEVGGNTYVLANTSNAAETVTASDPHAADMGIVLVGVHLGLNASDFHHT